MLSPNTICRKNLLQFLNTNKKNIKGETRKLIFAWRMSNWCPFWAHPPLTQRRQTEKINVKIKNRKSTIRSSHWKCSVRKGVLINFVKFTGKHLCQSLFFNKVAGLRFFDVFRGHRKGGLRTNGLIYVSCPGGQLWNFSWVFTVRGWKWRKFVEDNSLQILCFSLTKKLL